VDLDLLRGLAMARPAWSFVFVGPQRARADALRALPNVRMLGPRPHDVVLRVLSALDVGLIPYREVPAMAAASPVKLHEYLAYGLPVVSTDLPEIREHAPPVSIASDAQGFASAIERSLADGPGTSPPRGAPWRRRVDEMVALVSQALAGRREGAG
jgi:glycosyltransferase involved in cell wall biosynthesis